MKQSPLVVSFYTRGSLYEEEAKGLEASCKRFNVEYVIEGVASQGTWMHNCAFKPQFILQKIREWKRPIVWVDADARFRGIPEWGKFDRCDLALRRNAHFSKAHRSYLATGTLFVNPTEASLALLQEWQERCEEEMRHHQPDAALCLDQIVLARILQEKPHLRVDALPLSYAKVTLWDAGIVSAEETIIEHDLASRQMSTCALLDEQKKTFQEKKKAWRLSGIIDYAPGARDKVGDCCLSLIPFLSSMVVIMGAAEQHSKEERAEFAFLARLFPFGQFIELLPSYSLKERLALATMFVDSSFEHFLALPAEYMADTEQMTRLLVYKEFPSCDVDIEKGQIPAFFHKNSFSFISGKEENSCFIPWQATDERMSFLHHPYKEESFKTPPPNLFTIDERALERIEVARHLGISFL